MAARIGLTANAGEPSTGGWLRSRRVGGAAAPERAPHRAAGGSYEPAAVDRRNMFLLAGIAVLVRVILILAYTPVTTIDSASYLDLAHRLSSWHLQGSPGARTPGYPALLLLVGYSPTAIWCVQAALGVAATLLLYRLIRSLGGVPGVALIAALLYALDLEVLAVEHFVLTETVAGFLIIAASVIAVRTIGDRAQRFGLAWLLGLTLACLCIVRPDTLALAVYLAVGVGLLAGVRGTRSLGRGARLTAAALVPAVLVLAGWAAVNRATIGVTTVSTVLGHDMIDHVAPYVRVEAGADHAITAAYVAARSERDAHGGDLANLSIAAQPAIERATHLDAAHLSGRLLSIALGVIAHHPIQYVASSVKQWPRFFIPPNYPYSFTGGFGASLIHAIWKLQRAIRLLISIIFVVLCLAALVGFLRRRSGLLSAPGALLAGAVGVGLLVATFLAYGETGRYGYVYYPLVLAVSAVSAQPLAAMARERGRLARERTHASSA